MTPPNGEKARKERITLAQAQELIDSAVPDRLRSIRKFMVEQFARDMLAGNWRLHTAALGVNELGHMVDGNHRMRAFVKAATDGAVPYPANPHLAIDFWVVRGIKATVEVEDTIDTGRSRMYRDVLAIRGKPNANLMASITRRMWAWQMGSYYAGTGNPGSRVASFSEMDNFLEKYEEEIEIAAAYANNYSFEARLTPTSLAVAYIVLHRLDSEAADEFLSGVVFGDNVARNSVIGLLRRRYMNLDRSDGRDRNSSANQARRLGLMFMAWNYFRDGKQIAKLQLPKGGLTNKNFPLPK